MTTRNVVDVIQTMSLSLCVCFIQLLFHCSLADQHSPQQHAPRRTSRAYYYGSSGTNTNTNSAYNNSYEPPHYSSIADVWMCLFMALGWTVWMLSSFIRHDLFLFQYDSILVEGNVLSVQKASYDEYKALIDYKIQQDDENAIVYRKEFITAVSNLEPGFANAKLLVLPNDPTHAVLQQDWEEQVKDLQQDAPFWESTACKRASVSFTAILILMSIAGGIVHAERLDPLQRQWGYISVCLGVTLLLPTAILIHRSITCFQKTIDADTASVILTNKNRAMTPVTHGIELSSLEYCDHLDVLDARACDEEVSQLHLPHPSQRSTSSTQQQGCYFVTLPTQRTRSGQSSMSNNSVSTVSSISLAAHGESII